MTNDRRARLARCSYVRLVLRSHARETPRSLAPTLCLSLSQPKSLPPLLSHARAPHRLLGNAIIFLSLRCTMSQLPRTSLTTRMSLSRYWFSYHAFYSSTPHNTTQHTCTLQFQAHSTTRSITHNTTHHMHSSEPHSIESHVCMVCGVTSGYLDESWEGHLEAPVPEPRIDPAERHTDTLGLRHNTTHRG
jgi:hypothetical protein